MDCSPSGSSVHGILQARILEWVAMPSPGTLPNPGIEPASLTSPALAGKLFTTSTTWEIQNGSHWAKIKMSAGMYSFLESQGEPVSTPFPAS